MIPERLVRFRLHTILALLATIIAVAITLEVIWIARHVLTWVVISVFLALTLNPAVEWLQRHGIRSRGLAAAIAYLLTLAFFIGIGFTFVPTLVHQVDDFVHKLPSYVHDITHGRGRLGFLETKYHLQERVRHAVKTGGAKKALGLSGVAVSVAKGIISIVVGAITIGFMTFFMILEGPAWVERFYSLLPERSQPRWRKVGHDIYRTVGGYVTGNLLISVIAGVLTTLVLPAGIVVVAFFILYQQFENHVLQPVIYGRTVQLSPLAVLISILIGAELAGILGALAAIPVAGSIQVLLLDWRAHRGEHAPAPL